MKHLLLSLVVCMSVLSCKSDPPAEDRSYRRERAASEESPEVALEEPAISTGDEPMAGSGANAGQNVSQLPKGNWPFVGRRVFETRPAVTGTGTPHRYIDITPEGEVFFGYGLQNPKAGTMTGERVAAGKFRRVMKCVFKELGDTRYYVVGKSTIVELDASGNAFRSPDCCGNDQIDLETECPCQGKLFDPGGAPDPGL